MKTLMNTPAHTTPATDQTNDDKTSILWHVRQLLAGRRYGEVQAVQPLTHTGRNNRAYKVTTDSHRFFVKQYFTHAGDMRQRQLQEYAFSLYCWQTGNRQSPQAVAVDHLNHLTCFDYVEGAPYSAENGDLKSALKASTRFIASINENRHEADMTDTDRIPEAAEACFTIAHHYGCLKRRVVKLIDLIDHKAYSTQEEINAAQHARHLVQSRIAPLAMKYWHDIQERIKCFRQEDLPKVLRIISPSDFGLHNCMVRESVDARNTKRTKDTKDATDSESKYIFHDFEYAGWDDPAKLICDFFCQPQHPIPIKYMNRMIDDVLSVVDDDELHARVTLLFPIYELKWACMTLNEFLPVGRARREFSGIEVTRDRLLEQLKQSEHFINRAQRHMP